MEAAGLVVGAVGLASLFSACIDCFELVQRGRYLGRDYLLLETKFTNQRLRLATWGKACGFTDANDDQVSQLSQLEPEILDGLSSTLSQLLELFSNGNALRSTYGLKHEPCDGEFVLWTHARAHLGTRRQFLSRFRQTISGLKGESAAVQKQVDIARRGRWIIQDRQKFTDLVSHMKDLIDDLEAFTQVLDIRSRQQAIIRYEVESITDLTQLESMEAARCGVPDVISDVASFRLSAIRDSDRQSSRSGPYSEELPREEENPEDLHPEEGIDNPILTQSRHSGNSRSAHTSSGQHKEKEWEDITPDVDFADHCEDICYQTLHRVDCSSLESSIFLDIPSYNNKSRNDTDWVLPNRPGHPQCRTLHLAGCRPVPSLENYVASNPQLAFILIKTYDCEHSLVAREPGHQHSYEYSVYFNSETLCSWLDSNCGILDIEPGCFHLEPGSEVKEPFYQFYHSGLLKAYVKLRSTMENDAYADDDTQYPLNFQKGTEECFKLPKHGGTLLHVLQGCVGSKYAAADAMIEQRRITWSLLPYLFKPHELVVSGHDSGLVSCRAYDLLQEPFYENLTSGPQLSLQVSCWDFGPYFYRSETKFTILRRDFPVSESGSLSIDALFLLPLRHCKLVTRASLIERGRIFWAYRRGRYLSYTGPEETGLAVGERLSVDHLDPDSPEESLNVQRAESYPDDLGQKNFNAVDVPDEAFACTLPAIVCAWSPTSHIRRRIPVMYLGEVKWNRQLFDDLVLDCGSKELLRAAASCVTAPPGSDQVILLDGENDTGKTFAAKAFAELAARPLYRYNIALQLNNIDGIVNFLRRPFPPHLNCILLIEDADELLQERPVGNDTFGTLARHLMGFLDRHQGTVIFTTTRVRKFDHYIRSRTSLLVHFYPLTQEQRVEIWKLAIRDATAADGEIFAANDLLANVDDLEHHRLNGRLIKRSLRLAQQSANLQKRPVEFEILRAVLDYQGFGQ